MAEITQEQRDIITNEDYANLIIDYRNNPQILQGIPNSTVQIMNEAFAVIYIPVSQLGNRGTIGTFGYSVTPSLYGLTSEVAVDASGVDTLRKTPNFNLRGSGVLIGIVDTGINYTLPIFKNADGTTRIYTLWDQNITSDNFPRPELFGTVFSQEQINQAINSSDPQSVVPSVDEIGHGTALAAVAAGTEVDEADFEGVAPESELVIVKLRPAKKYLKDYFIIPNDVVCYQEDYIMWGIQYCIEAARSVNKPISICLGLGSSQGAHDGRSALSVLSSLLASFPKTGLTASAGNEGNLGRHFYGVIKPAIGKIEVDLNVAENEGGFSMELWGDAPGIYSLDILSPAGEYISRIPAGLRVSRQIAFIFEPTIIDIDYQTVENETGDQLILIRMHNVSAGTWKFTVYGQGDLSSSFHIWLPMGNMISRDTRFVQPDIYTTVLAPGTADAAFTVTAYNPLNNTLYVNASRGYTRANDIKPELAAPGVNYIAPDKDGRFINYTGTGIAAAHGTGIIALLLEWGVVLGEQANMSTIEAKNYLIRGAKRTNTLVYPNRDWGFGSIDIYNTFNVLRINV
jgi:hypothetical protein